MTLQVCVCVCVYVCMCVKLTNQTSNRFNEPPCTQLTWKSGAFPKKVVADTNIFNVDDMFFSVWFNV